MNDKERIGKMIADIRTEQGLTVRELADLAGVASPNICKIENGKYSPGVDVLSRILSAMSHRLTIENLPDIPEKK
ncbi:helix-turn-helix domain-containing protein [Bacteroides pyogenes]|uniref:helix-turn-helix domain-containing protein n=1 Tax=Bacteroides pyogenes TaxID=310300 RepID=UPI0040644066